jgi:SH3-like domain-containing protein
VLGEGEAARKRALDADFVIEHDFMVKQQLNRRAPFVISEVTRWYGPMAGWGAGMRIFQRLTISMLLVLLAAEPVLAQKKPPYWASISAGAARMRTGPGRQFPAMWEYRRSNLPVKVLAVYGEWRKVEDPDGTQGWMLATLLSAERSGMIRSAVAPMRESPSTDARILFRAQPGVVGRISECAKGWCRFDVMGRMGFVEAGQMWGIDAAEAKP